MTTRRRLPLDVMIHGASAVVTVRGVPTYVESSGQGSPLLYLHGATEWVGYSTVFVNLLQEAHCVVQPERRGHGRTADVPGDLSFQIMAEDTIGVIEQLDLARPDLVGFSDGANIALMVAMSRPDLVGRIVAIGPNMSVAAFTDETRAWLDSVTPESWPAECRRQYEALSPDGPDHWPVFAEKVIEMLRREPDIATEALGVITAPTLVIGADRDMFQLEHFIAIHRAIPDSELCIIPGADHELTVEQPELTAAHVLRFLDKDSAPAGGRSPGVSFAAPKIRHHVRMAWPTQQPVLFDDLVLLRGFTEADADAIFRACQDPDIQHFTQVPVPYHRSSADAFIAHCKNSWSEGVTGNFAVCDLATGEFLGDVGVIGADHEAGTAGLGYWTAPWGRGRHATTRAVRLVTEWALDAGGLRILTAEAEIANPASMHVLANAGYSRLDVPDEVIELKGSLRRFTSWQADTITSTAAGVALTS